MSNIESLLQKFRMEHQHSLSNKKNTYLQNSNPTLDLNDVQNSKSSSSSLQNNEPQKSHLSEEQLKNFLEKLRETISKCSSKLQDLDKTK